MLRHLPLFSAAVAVTLSAPAFAALIFTTGTPDGRIAVGARPPSHGKIEIETGDDFILSSQTIINGATFTGLLPAGLPLSSIAAVDVELYRVFPLDSVNPPSGNVPTRVNSPSDNAFATRGSTASNLTYTTSILNASFTAANSVLNGINKIPNQTTGGEGPVTGEEVLFNVTFTTPFSLPADHYFFVPQVQLTSGDFLWLSTPRPGPIFPGDLQAWARNANLDPDWLRVGTDIVGGSPAPTFNMAFSLDGTVAVPEPSTFTLILSGLALAGLARFPRRLS